MLDSRYLAGFVLLMTTAACGHGSSRIDDPIDGVPLARQRAVSRTEFGFRWPLSVGVGVLACDQAGAILFRTQGTTYPLTGRGSRISDLAPYRMLEPSGPPTNPLRRVKQTDRMAVFASVMSCAPRDTSCSDAALQRVGLTRDEWSLIETEGRERLWPPLPRGPMPLDPLIAAGRPLCDR